MTISSSLDLFLFAKELYEAAEKFLFSLSFAFEQLILVCVMVNVRV